MARSAAASRSSSGRRGYAAAAVAAVRDNSAIANTDPLADVLYRPVVAWPALSISRPRVLTDDSDLRRWSPVKYPVVYGGGRARVQSRPKRIAGSPYKFLVPAKTLVCVRRKQRREVLFAKGRGGGRHRKPRYNSFSAWRC